MGQRIADKLRERGGVTILMALFAMLVASMVCIVILGAAVTSVKQAKSYQEHEQNTLALQSAGELVRSQIQKTGTVTFKQVTDDEDRESYGPGSCSESCPLSGVLIAIAGQSLSSIRTDDLYPCDATITASVTGAEGAADYNQEVEANFVLRQPPEAVKSGSSTPLVDSANAVGSQDCQLIVTLSTKDASGEPQYLYLKYSGCKRTISEQEDPSLLKATFTWGDGSFYLAEDVVSNA